MERVDVDVLKLVKGGESQKRHETLLNHSTSVKVRQQSYFGLHSISSSLFCGHHAKK